MSNSQQWFESVRSAFPDQDLCARIYNAASTQPTLLPQLFEDISRHVLSSHDSQPSTKKRKLENGGLDIPSTHQQKSTQSSAHTTLFHCTDVSFQIPARKKLKLEIAADSHDKEKFEVRAVNPNTQELEYYLPGSAIDEVFCLPVPEKQARQMNFCVIPKPGSILSDGRVAEQMVFVMSEVPVVPGGSAMSIGGWREDDTYVSLTTRTIEKVLMGVGKSVVVPDGGGFASAVPQSHRKGEKAYHVKAHRSAKEGYLFFLPTGILFGFKKPLAFFPFSSIESISYTSVLQRTFNLVITTQDNDQAQAKEVEFSMLDQADFAGIDDYVKRHSLNDASMAAQRRAKAFNVNKERKAETNGEASAGGQAEEGPSELAKAEQELQDAEDEEEEDYEASGGESDGEGEVSDDEDGVGDGDEGEEEVEYEEDDEVEEIG